MVFVARLRFVLFKDCLLNVIHKKNLLYVDNSEEKNGTTTSLKNGKLFSLRGWERLAERSESVVSWSNLINAKGHYRNARKCHR